MGEKPMPPRTLEQARKDKWLCQVAQARRLGELATLAIDDALQENAQVINFPERPDPNPPEVVA